MGSSDLCHNSHFGRLAPSLKLFLQKGKRIAGTKGIWLRPLRASVGSIRIGSQRQFYILNKRRGLRKEKNHERIYCYPNANIENIDRQEHDDLPEEHGAEIRDALFLLVYQGGG